MVTNRIYDSIGELIMACETVRGADRCDKCPIGASQHCLEECSFETVAYKVTVKQIEQLIYKADEITEAQEEAEKTEAERAWEAEADYWNDRRCDPE